MKKLLFVTLLFICSLSISAQPRPIGVDSEKGIEYREQIGLDMSIPDFELKKIDEAKMGTHLADLLNYLENNYTQGTTKRWITSVLREQYEEFKNVLYPEIKKIKLQSASKTGNALSIVYKIWLGPNTANIKQTVATFHFTDGISESRAVNEMFSYMSRYVQAKEQLNK